MATAKDDDDDDELLVYSVESAEGGGGERRHSRARCGAAGLAHGVGAMAVGEWLVPADSDAELPPTSRRSLRGAVGSAGGRSLVGFLRMQLAPDASVGVEAAQWLRLEPPESLCGSCAARPEPDSALCRAQVSLGPRLWWSGMLLLFLCGTGSATRCSKDVSVTCPRHRPWHAPQASSTAGRSGGASSALRSCGASCCSSGGCRCRRPLPSQPGLDRSLLSRGRLVLLLIERCDVPQRSCSEWPFLYAGFEDSRALAHGCGLRLRDTPETFPAPPPRVHDTSAGRTSTSSPTTRTATAGGASSSRG